MSIYVSVVTLQTEYQSFDFWTETQLGDRGRDGSGRAKDPTKALVFNQVQEFATVTVFYLGPGAHEIHFVYKSDIATKEISARVNMTAIATRE